MERLSELYKLPFPHSPALLLVSGYAPMLHERLFTCTVDHLVIIYISAANMDFSTTSAVLTFSVSTSTQCEQVTIIDDIILENSEIFFMQLESTDPAVEITLGSAPVTILDNDSEYGITMMSVYSCISILLSAF